jgi:hypothetical protein
MNFDKALVSKADTYHANQRADRPIKALGEHSYPRATEGLGCLFNNGRTGFSLPCNPHQGWIAKMTDKYDRTTVVFTAVPSRLALF